MPQTPDAVDRNLPLPPSGSSLVSLPPGLKRPAAPITGNELANSLGNIPVLGGLLNFGADQIGQNALGGPQYGLESALGKDYLRNPKPNADVNAAGQIALNTAFGAVGALENKGIKALSGLPLDSEQLAARIGAVSPKQRAAADALKAEVAAREARAGGLGGTGGQIPAKNATESAHSGIQAILSGKKPAATFQDVGGADAARRAGLRVSMRKVSGFDQDTGLPAELVLAAKDDAALRRLENAMSMNRGPERDRAMGEALGYSREDINAYLNKHPGGLGGTGGKPPVPPEGPKFSGGQFPKDTQGTLGQIQQDPLLKAARPTIPLETQQHLADQLKDKSLPQLVKDLQVAGPGRLSSTVLETNQRVAGMIGKSNEFRSAIAAGTATEADRANLALAYKEALFGRAAAVGATSEAARTVGAQGRIPITARLSPKDAKVFDAIGELAKTDPGKFDEIAGKLVDISHDPKKLDAFTRAMAEQPDFWTRASDAFFEYYRSNVLWNIATHVTNTTSGLFQVGSYVAREAIKNPRTLKNVPELGKGYAYAAANLLPERAQNFLSAHVGLFDNLPEQLAMSSASDKYGAIQGAIPGPIGSAVRIPFKVLSLADLFQTKSLYNFALKNYAEAEAAARGLKGDAAKAFVNNLPADAFNAIHEKAWKDAEEFALHATGGLSQAIQQFRSTNILGKLLILFVNTPVNLAKVGVRFSPLGGFRAIDPRLLMDASRRSAELPNIAAETVVGSAVTAGFLSLLASDNMTGLTPKTPSERTLWEAEGRQPMSIRASEYPLLGPALKIIYGDKADKTWVPVTMLGPLLYPALISAAAAEVTHDGGTVTPEHVLQATGAAGQTILNTLPLFQQYRGINDLLSNPSAQTATAFASNLLRPLIPAESGLAMVERITDGFKRDPKDLRETLQALLPHFAQSIRQDYDVLGNPLTVQTGVGGVLPKATTEQVDPVSIAILAEDRRLREANPNFAGLNKPSNTIGSGDKQIKLDADQYNLYEQLAGQAKKEALTKLLADPKYQAADNAEKSRQFENTESQAQKSALTGLGIKLASTSLNQDTVVMGARLATNSGDNYQQAKALRAIGKNLTPAVKQQLDALRANPDKKQAALDGKTYDPSVDELFHGADLVDAWLKAPEFSYGNKAQWDAAARSAELLRHLVAADKAQGKDPAYDANVTKFYYSQPGLSQFYTESGNPRSNLKSYARQTIEKDLDWRYFSSAANAAEDRQRTAP